MRRLFILSAAVTLVVAVTSVSLVAQRPGGPGRGEGRGGRPGVESGDAHGPRRGGPGGAGGFAGRFGGGPGFGLGRNLDLTEEQRAKVQDIVRASRDTVAPMASELRLAQSALRRELFADTPDEPNVKALSTKVTELRRQMADIRIGTSASIAALLTPEQREKMRAGMERGAGVGRGGPGRGAGRGGARGAAAVRS